MKDLIKALQILLKYGNPSYPTVCIHDELRIVGIEPEKITAEDKDELQKLGFEINIEGEYCDEIEEEHDESIIYSFKYGSA